MTDGQSSVTPSITSSFRLPQPPASVPPLQLVNKGVNWQRVEHAPSKRRDVEQSQIWDHGTDYVRVDDDKAHAWRCLYCFKNDFVLLAQDATSNSRRHLRPVHGVILNNATKRSREVFEEDDEPSDSPKVKGTYDSYKCEHFSVSSDSGHV